jgi:hypothetical protein
MRNKNSVIFYSSLVLAFIVSFIFGVFPNKLKDNYVVLGSAFNGSVNLKVKDRIVVEESGDKVKYKLYTSKDDYVERNKEEILPFNNSFSNPSQYLFFQKGEDECFFFLVISTLSTPEILVINCEVPIVDTSYYVYCPFASIPSSGRINYYGPYGSRLDNGNILDFFRLSVSTSGAFKDIVALHEEEAYIDVKIFDKKTEAFLNDTYYRISFAEDKINGEVVAL